MQHVGLRLRGRRACPGAQERDHNAGSLEHGFLLGEAALPAACPQQVAYFSTMKELTRSSEGSRSNRRRFYAVLPLGGIRSPLDAVRAAIVAEKGGDKMRLGLFLTTLIGLAGASHI